MLRAIAERIEAICGDAAFRIDGDEFVALVDRRTVWNAVVMAEAVLTSDGPAPVLVGGIMCSSAPRVGVAPFAETEIDGGELFRKADVALYQGQGGGTRPGGGLRHRARRRNAPPCPPERKLRQAIAAPEQFEAHYQPVVEAVSPQRGLGRDAAALAQPGTGLRFAR